MSPRILEELPDQSVDTSIQGRREEEALSAFFRSLEDLPYRWEESHICHLIGLIKDGYLQCIQLDLTTLHQIDKASRSRDKDGGRVLQRCDLSTKGQTTSNDN